MSKLTTLAVGLAVWLMAGLLGVTAPVAAQEYPEPTPTPEPPPPDTCVVVRGHVNGTFVAQTVDLEALVEVEGGPGCSSNGGTFSVSIIFNPTIHIDENGQPSQEQVVLQARADGSWRHTFCLPEEVPPGDHILRGETDTRGVIDRPLRVTSNLGVCPVEVLGTVETPAVAVEGGLLPRTGLDLLLLILWALILVLVGTVLAVSSWRWAQRFQPVRAATFRNGLPHRDHGEPEVPMIDTSGFDPVRRARSRSATSRSTTSQGSSAKRKGPASKWGDGKPRRRPKS